MVLLISSSKHKVLPFYVLPLLLPASAAEELFALYSSPNFGGESNQDK
jgi:hypothetical protein